MRYVPNHHLKTGKRKPRKLGGAKDAEICHRYEAGEGIGEISAALKINKTTVYRVLKRQGVPSNRRLSEGDKAEIQRRYESGERGGSLAKDFGVTKEAIYKMLEQVGVSRRPWHGPPPILTTQQDAEVSRRYREGETSKSIARDFGVSMTTILKVLDRCGVPRNDRAVYPSAKRLALRVLSAPQEVEVCRRYEAGESIPTLAKALGVGGGAIDGALKRNGVQRRPGVAGQPLTPDQEREVCERYQAGQNTKAISEATGVGAGTIWHVLVRNGVERHREPVRYSSEQKAEAIERYNRGERVREIDTTLGISPTSLYKILREQGMEPTRASQRLQWEEAEAAKVIRSLPAYRKWRLAVLRRDGRACQECGAHSTTENPLHVHHLQSFAAILAEYRPINVDDAQRYAALWDSDNGVTLCAVCHRQAHAASEPL